MTDNSDSTTREIAMTDNSDSTTTLAIRRPAAVNGYNPPPDRPEFAALVEMANNLAKAQGFIPAHFNGQPYKILAAMLYGRDLGITPTNALQHIIVIDGKATADAQLMGMLVRRGGHRLEDATTDTSSTVKITRGDDGSTHTFTFSMQDAARAGLVRPGSAWQKYPQSMLYARALTGCARKGAQDALMGVIYTPEELGAEMGEDGEIVSLPASAIATGEIPLAQVSPETVAALKEAAKPLATEPVSPAAMSEAVPVPQASGSDSTPPPTPTATAEAPATPPPSSAPAAASTTFHRLGRSVGPTAKRTNVIQAPTVTATPVETATQSPVSTEVISGQPAPSAPADEAERIPFDDEVDEGQQVYLRQLRSDLREQAATLAHLNAIARNHKAALEGKPQEVVPPATPSTESDALLEARIGHDWSGQTLATLDEAAITALSERFEPMILKRRDQLKEKGIAE